MKTEMNQVSLDAFEVAKIDMGKNQAKVLWAIYRLNTLKIPASDRQIAKLLSWEINRVVPRRSELEKMKRIYSIGRMFDGLSQVQVNIWKVRGGL